MGAAIGVVTSVLGMGGGGGLLGGLLGGIGKLISGFLNSTGIDGIVKSLTGFSPSNIINAATNLFSSVIGGGAKQAVQTLAKEDGMPKFIQNAVEKAVDKVMKDQYKPTDRCCQDNLNDAVKDDAQKSMQDLAKQIVDSVRRQMTDSTGECCNSSGKKGAKSWLQAIAQAMGEAMGNKAAKMVELSNKLKTQSSAGGDDQAQAKAAKEMQATNAEFQAVSQEFKLLTDAFSTAIKALGEGGSAMARKN